MLDLFLFFLVLWALYLKSQQCRAKSSVYTASVVLSLLYLPLPLKRTLVIMFGLPGWIVVVVV